MTGFIAMAACVAQREPLYELPADMLPSLKVLYTKHCEKGKILYDINCGGCHNTKKGRKEIIPDFQPGQLAGYSLRVSNAKHGKNLPDSLVTEEELAIIMIFLSYKRKNVAGK